jgi:adenylylsulfate kinase-like enzyme
LLDGDDLREIFGATNSNSDDYKRETRVNLALKYSNLCRLISNKGLIVVIATISLFSEVNLWNRKNLNGYYEVYIKVPIEELRRRDQKGIYSRFERGELKNVLGLDLKIDEPSKPDLLLEYKESQSAVIFADELIRNLNI